MTNIELKAKIQYIFNSISLDKEHKNTIIDIINDVINDVINAITDKTSNISKVNIINTDIKTIEPLNEDDDISVVIDKVNSIIYTLNKIIDNK